MKTKYVGQIIDQLNNDRVCRSTLPKSTWEEAQHSVEKLAKKSHPGGRYALRVVTIDSGKLEIIAG